MDYTQGIKIEIEEDHGEYMWRILKTNTAQGTVLIGWAMNETMEGAAAAAIAEVKRKTEEFENWLYGRKKEGA